MVVKVDKSEAFKKSGKKLISEYEGEKWEEEIKKTKSVPQHLAE